MTPTSWSLRRRLCLLALLVAIVSSVTLSIMASVWFFAPMPFLVVAVYAVVVGMSPTRFWDALDEGSGSGAAPF